MKSTVFSGPDAHASQRDFPAHRPAGVCDWSLAGVEQQDLLGTWVFFD